MKGGENMADIIKKENFTNNKPVGGIIDLSGDKDVNSPSLREHQKAFLKAQADGTLVAFGGVDSWARVWRTEKGGIVLEPAGTLEKAMREQPPKVTAETVARLNRDLARGTASLIKVNAVLNQAMDAGQPLHLAGYYPAGSEFKRHQLSTSPFGVGTAREEGVERKFDSVSQHDILFKGRDGKYYPTSDAMQRADEEDAKRNLRYKSSIAGREYPVTREGAEQMQRDEDQYYQNQMK